MTVIHEHIPAVTRASRTTNHSRHLQHEWIPGHWAALCDTQAGSTCDRFWGSSRVFPRAASSSMRLAVTRLPGTHHLSHREPGNLGTDLGTHLPHNTPQPSIDARRARSGCWRCALIACSRLWSVTVPVGLVRCPGSRIDPVTVYHSHSTRQTFVPHHIQLQLDAGQDRSGTHALSQSFHLDRSWRRSDGQT